LWDWFHEHYVDNVTLTTDWSKGINGVSKPSGGIHPDDTDVNILSTGRATGLNLEIEVCILSAKSIKMTLALGTRSQALPDSGSPDRWGNSHCCRELEGQTCLSDDKHSWTHWSAQLGAIKVHAYTVIVNTEWKFNRLHSLEQVGFWFAVECPYQHPLVAHSLWWVWMRAPREDTHPRRWCYSHSAVCRKTLCSWNNSYM